LDLNAGSGLLTWEILRRAPEGGTWALARERQTGEGLRQQVERLPKLSRPVILVGGIDELPDLLALRGESEIRFDAMVGWNTLGRIPDKVAALQMLRHWLRAGSLLSLVETVPGQGQRLYDLLELSTLGDEISARLVAAEESIYTNPTDPLVSWDARFLADALTTAGFEDVELEEVDTEEEQLISQATVERWFDLEANGERPSYAQHLRKKLAPEELGQVEALFYQQLAGETVIWTSKIVFVVGQKA
jgi:putative ATPase